jgi:cupredoxin-like protein
LLEHQALRSVVPVFEWSLARLPEFLEAARWLLPKTKSLFAAVDSVFIYALSASTTEGNKSATSRLNAVLFGEERRGIGRTVWIVVIVVIVASVAVIEYGIGLGSSSSSGGAKEVDVQIIEDNPVLQIDHFYPAHIYVPMGENVSLAVLNTDDETRVFTLPQFNINLTMSSGTTQRITFDANKLGNFTFISPVTPPSPVSQGRPGKCLQGFFIVIQNASLITSSSSSGSGAPGSTYCPNPLGNPLG